MTSVTENIRGLDSTSSQAGEIITQIICFQDGSKTTIENINSSTIKQNNSFTHFKSLEGDYCIKSEKVIWFEVHKIDKPSDFIPDIKDINLSFEKGFNKTIKGIFLKQNEFIWFKTPYGFFVANLKHINYYTIC